MTVSVLIPTYRRPDSLVRCLEAIAAGERLPDRIIVTVRDIDEATQQALRGWIAAHPALAVTEVTVDVPGQIPAMNAGLAAATENVVCFIDDDTVPRRDWLARLLSHYDDPQVGGVGGRDLVHQQGEVLRGTVHAVGELRWYGRMIGNHHLDYDGEAVQVAHLKGANMSFRRALLSPFDLRMATGSCCLNDTDASLSVTDQGYRLIYDPGAVVDHVVAPRFTAPRDTADLELVYSDSHNWVYCLFKHFRRWQRPVFFVYAVLVGEGTRFGLAKALFVRPGRLRAALRQFAASTRGKCSALRTYAAWAREHS